MKAMQCELCGGTDIIKDGDFFVCQSCGMKYTPESAKKMMVEGVVQVEGTVKVDNSQQIENFLSLAKKAQEMGNLKEAEEYANKVLEIDLDNWQALYVKGLAAGWQSGIGNSRIIEAVDYFHKAISNCKEQDKLQVLINDISNDLCDLTKAMTQLRCETFAANPTNENKDALIKESRNFVDILSDLDVVSDSSLQTYKKEASGLLSIAGIEAYTKVLLRSNMDTLASSYTARNEYYSGLEAYIEVTDYAFSLNPVDHNFKIRAYEQLIKSTDSLLEKDELLEKHGYPRILTSANKTRLLNKKKSWNTNISTEEKQAKKEKTDSYWEKHPEEKEKLQEDLAALKRSKEEALSKDEYKEVTKKIKALNQKLEDLTKELKNCGVFAVKNKKKLNAQIDVIERELILVRKKKKSLDAEINKTELEIKKTQMKLDQPC